MKFFVSICTSVVLVHALEDTAMLSIGRFLPVPVYILYPVGILFSALILSTVILKLLSHKT